MNRGEKTGELDEGLRMFLHAGPLSMMFDLDDLFIRRISFGGVEILRGIYPALRDRNWGTLKPEVTIVDSHRNAYRFELHLSARFKTTRPSFAWDAFIEGTQAGRITYRIKGTALDDVVTNRAGFCVLHPASVAGMPCSVRHGNGRMQAACFPGGITPHQPFLDVASISHEPAPGLQVTVEMKGDVFETEDQRNWTDASFKTYCRPLSRPFPYKIPQGSTFEQEVVVLVGTQTPGKRVALPPNKLVLSNPSRTVAPPRVGLYHGGAGPLGEDAARILQAATPEHLRINLCGSADAQQQQLRAAIADAVALNCRLIVAVDISNAAHAEQFAAAICGMSGLDRVDWLPLHSESPETDEQTFNFTTAAWEAYQIPGAIGAGVRSNFAEYNRLRPSWNGMAFATCAVSPQVHASDMLSMVETLSVLPMVVRQMREMSKVPVAISPVSLVPLHNPVATTSTAGDPPADPRLHTSFGAAWTLGALAALASGGAERVTLHAATGPHGIVPSGASAGSPLFQLFLQLSSLSSSEWGIVEDSLEGIPCGIVARHTRGFTALIANLSPDERPLEIAQDLGTLDSQKLLCSREGEDSQGSGLPPWSITRFDFSA